MRSAPSICSVPTPNASRGALRHSGHVAVGRRWKWQWWQTSAPSRAVPGERDAAVRAAGGHAARWALEVGREAPAVQEDQRLPAGCEVRLEGLPELVRDHGAITLRASTLAEIDDRHLRQRVRRRTVRQLEQRVPPLASGVVALGRRGRRRQHHDAAGEPRPDHGQVARIVAEALLLLVGCVVLLVDDDETAPRQRREHRGARAHDDPSPRRRGCGASPPSARERPSPLCSTATRSPKRARTRSTSWCVRAISGTRIRTPRPAARLASAAVRKTSVLPLPVTPWRRNEAATPAPSAPVIASTAVRCAAAEGETDRVGSIRRRNPGPFDDHALDDSGVDEGLQGRSADAGLAGVAHGERLRRRCRDQPSGTRPRRSAPDHRLLLRGGRRTEQANGGLARCVGDGAGNDGSYHLGERRQVVARGPAAEVEEIRRQEGNRVEDVEDAPQLARGGRIDEARHHAGARLAPERHPNPHAGDDAGAERVRDLVGEEVVARNGR